MPKPASKRKRTDQPDPITAELREQRAKELYWAHCDARGAMKTSPAYCALPEEAKDEWRRRVKTDSATKGAT